MVLLSSISKIKVCYSLSSLFFLLFLIQTIANHRGKDSYDCTTSSEVEKIYRKRYNLLDGPAEVGDECTLGNSLIIFPPLKLVAILSFFFTWLVEFMN